MRMRSCGRSLRILSTLLICSAGALASGTAHAGVSDCDGNGVDDSLQPDCDTDGLIDACAIAFGGARDCDNNEVPDSCDIDSGDAFDCNTNEVPDRCEVDCNDNGLADSCDIAAGTSPDCNDNGLPDECDVRPVEVPELPEAPPAGPGYGVSNGVYTLGVSAVEDGSGVGTWQAHTGPLHPTGQGNDLLYDYDRFVDDNGTVVEEYYTTTTNFSSLRVYQDDNGTFADYAPFLAGDTATWDMDDYVLDEGPIGTTGWYTEWDLTPDALGVFQEVIVTGTTFATSAVYHTVTITNHAETTQRVGWRNLYDWQVTELDDNSTLIDDDGPSNIVETARGEIVRPEATTEFLHVPGDNEVVRIHAYPGPSSYDVVQSLGFDPRFLPDRPVTLPEAYGFVSWPNSVSTTFAYEPNPLQDVADPASLTGTHDDSAGLTWFGRTYDTALVLAPGESVELTQVLFGTLPDEPPPIGGGSEDCDENLVPDECQPDCDEDEVTDVCAILEGTVDDVNDNQIPDSCEDQCLFDVTPPQLQCAESVTVECVADAGTLDPSQLPASASDECSEVDPTAEPLGPYDLGTTPVTVTATDALDNVATCVIDVEVEDTAAPQLTCPGDVSVGTADDACEASGVTLGDATVADACQVAEPPVATSDAPATYDLGDTTVTFTATDAAGNANTCETTVTVVDDVPPVITCDETAERAVPSDACVFEGTFTAAVVDNCREEAFTAELTEAFPLGESGVPFVASDDAGNEATCTTTLTVVDETAPVLSCDEAAQRVADDDCAWEGTLSASATDNCAEEASSVDVTDTHAVGESAVVFTATDDSGNVATCTTTLTVVDETAPALVCDEAATRAAAADACEWQGTLSATATDNCDGAFSVDVADTHPVGESAVVFTATDAAGNEVTCTTTLTVVDETGPVLTCDETVERVVAGDACAWEGTLTATGADNCGEESLSVDVTESHALGESDVVFTATDAVGNEGSCTTTLTVLDETAPVLTCDTTLERVAPVDACAWTGTLTATGTDNCAEEGLTVDVTDSHAVGEDDVVFTATDESGNEATCTTTLTVVDETAPAVTCGTLSATSGVVAPTVNDACGVVVTVAITGCESGGETLDPCPVTVADGTLVVSAGERTTATDVSYEITAVDPSGNSTSEDCDVEVPANAEATEFLVTGGGGCQAGGGGDVPLWLAFAVGLLALVRRRRALAQR